MHRRISVSFLILKDESEYGAKSEYAGKSE